MFVNVSNICETVSRNCVVVKVMLVLVLFLLLSLLLSLLVLIVLHTERHNLHVRANSCNHIFSFFRRRHSW